MVHRSDGSGTTFVFTDYLSKISPEWKGAVGKGTSVQWPTGLGGKGNEGVTQQVKQTEGAVGYVELIYAISNGLPYAWMKNAEGAFIEPSLKSVSAAAAGARLGPDTDFRVSITGASGKDSYPIASFTWLLVPRQPGTAPRPGCFTGSFYGCSSPSSTDGRRSALRAAPGAGDRVAAATPLPEIVLP